MKILIYGLNFSPELTGIGKYSGEMSAWFVAHGHEVSVITAPPYYPEWRVAPPYSPYKYRTETIEGARVTRCPLYVPREPRAFSRVLHLLSFAISSLPVLIRSIFWRPDAVICVVPTLFCVPGALMTGWLARARTIVHIQDLEIDAMLGLNLGSPGRMVRLAFWLERWLLRRADVVTSISESMVRRIRLKMGADARVALFPNWVDTGHVTPSSGPSPYRQEWGIPESSIVILYSGNIGHKQGLECVLQAAAAFSDDSRVQFVIVGSGANSERLMAQAKSLGLANVRFFPLQPYSRLPDLLALADIHLVVQKRGAADLVMPSKLTTILAAGGHALITAEEDTELGRLCRDHPGIAALCLPESVGQLTESIQNLLQNRNILARRPNQTARNYAETCLERDRVIRTFLDTVLRIWM